MTGLALLALVPAVLVWLSTTGGPGLSQDSVSYLAAARSFAAGDGLITYTGDPLTLFPPGLPLVLGLAESVGWRAESAAVALNAACAALIVVGAYLLARACGLGRVGAFAVAAFTSLSSATVSVFAWLWTEPLFALLVLGALILLVGMIRRRDVRWGPAIGVAVLVSAATGVRYVGLVMIGIAALGAWLALRDDSRSLRWRWVAIVGSMSSIGLLAVAARNLILGSGPLGERYPGTRTLEGALEATIEVLGSYVAPPQATMLTAEVGVLVAVLLGVGAWLAVIRRDDPLTLLAAFVGLYLAAIVWSQAATRLDSASTRLLSPAFVPLVVLGVYAIRETVRAMGAQVGRRTSRVMWTLVWAGFGLVLAASLVQGARFVNDARANGIGLAAGAASSELASAVAELPVETGSASNDPWLVYLRVGEPPVRPLPPSAGEWPADRVAADTRRLVDAVRSGRVTHAAVFDDGGAIEPLEALAAEGIVAEPVAELADGMLYRLTPAP